MLAWAVGRLVPGQHLVAQAGVKGLYFGLFVGLGLGLVDAFGNLSFRPFLRTGGQVSFALLVGAASGVIGGVVGQFLYGCSGLAAFLVLGWAVTGLLLGTAPGAFDLVGCLVTGKSFRGALRKMQHGSLGGLAGGLLGGLLLVKMLSSEALPEGNADPMWSPGAIGFVVLGCSIGLAFGLAQVLFKEAWLRVDTGFRPGRELILSRSVTTIGSTAACDVRLFGDPTVEPRHVQILSGPEGYLLAPIGPSSTTSVNGQPVQGQIPLRSGDVIGVGNYRLSFGQRRKSLARTEVGNA